MASRYAMPHHDRHLTRHSSLEYPIKVQHAERKLAYESKVLYLFSPTGVDKEDWFLKLSSAAALFNPVRKYLHFYSLFNHF